MTSPRSKRQSPIRTTDALRVILLIRGQRVLLDADIAQLYRVSTKALVQAVKRNRQRFPADFMFQLRAAEFDHLRSQIVTSSWGGRRSRPYAFTEEGVAMLSSVLRSRRAIAVNIAIMRAFVQLRKMISESHELARRIDELEKRYDADFKVVFDAIRALIQPKREATRRIGFLDFRSSAASARATRRF